MTRISSPWTSQDTMNPSDRKGRLPDFSRSVLMSLTCQGLDSFGLVRAQLGANPRSHSKDNVVAPLTNVKLGRAGRACLAGKDELWLPKRKSLRTRGATG